MPRRVPAAVSLVLWAGVGCTDFDRPQTPAVPPTAARPEAAAGQVARVSYAPASTEAAARVDTLGRKIVTANPQTGLKPQFRTIGAPEPEVFHRGTAEVLVTEGLVSRCKTDGDLAAVLCRELGKMVAEREALAAPGTRAPDRLPPLETRIGNDSSGAFGPADQTHLAELAKYEKERGRPAAAAPPPPDPQALARTYLTKAGFAAGDLDTAAPVFQAAAANATFERQLNPSAPSRSWLR